MICPTCDCTMSRVLYDDGREVSAFHCPRCGTVLIDHHNTMIERAVLVPALVGRCRDYATGLAECGTPSPSYLADDWKKLGIAESINKPGDHPS